VKSSSEIKLTGETTKGAAPYWQVWFVNYTPDWTLVELSFDGVNWFPVTPPVPQNCTYLPATHANIDRCHDEGHSSFIGTVPCNQQANIHSRFKDAAGHVGDLAPWNFYTDCQNGRGIILVLAP
jgi:hypothetical protein